MIISAIFVCTYGSCQLASPPYVSPLDGRVHPAQVFRSKADCVRALKNEFGDVAEYAHGRIELNSDMYYECLGKHVSTWHR